MLDMETISVGDMVRRDMDGSVGTVVAVDSTYQDGAGCVKVQLGTHPDDGWWGTAVAWTLWDEVAQRRSEIEAGVPELADIEANLAEIRQALLEDRHDDAMNAWVVIHQMTSHFVATSGSW